jgi:hypothetical protein
MMAKRTTIPWLIAAVLSACTDPPPSQRQFLIEQPRLIALTATPSEVLPGQPVALGAVWAAPTPAISPLATPSLWSICIEPKAPSEDNSVSPLCAGDAGSALVSITGGQEMIAGNTWVSQVTATVPADSCGRFGPDTPPGGFRPRAADSTGGYYQPFKVQRNDFNSDVSDAGGFGLVRMTCNLAGAPPGVSQQYRQQYVANAVPIAELMIPATVAPQQRVDMVVRWSDNQRESYLWYDPATATLQTRRESMGVSWFATDGEMQVDAVSVGEAANASQVLAGWTAPSTGGVVQIWAVVRDSRGGQAILSAIVPVQ